MQAQPGDPYAAERAARAERARELFSDGGQVNHYAEVVHRRAQADVRYLSLWRTLGAMEAGRRTCAEFGHDQHGRQCLRCGAYVA